MVFSTVLQLCTVIPMFHGRHRFLSENSRLNRPAPEHMPATHADVICSRSKQTNSAGSYSPSFTGMGKVTPVSLSSLPGPTATIVPDFDFSFEELRRRRS